MKANWQHITHKSACFTEDRLLAYLQGKLTHRECFEVENHLADCEMCSDVLDGLMQLNGDEHRIQNAENDLRERVRVLLNTTGSATRSLARPLWWAAAAVTILFVGSSVYFFLYQPSERIQQAMQSVKVASTPNDTFTEPPKGTEIALAPKDKTEETPAKLSSPKSNTLQVTEDEVLVMEDAISEAEETISQPVVQVEPGAPIMRSVTQSNDEAKAEPLKKEEVNRVPAPAESVAEKSGRAEANKSIRKTEAFDQQEWVQKSDSVLMLNRIVRNYLIQNDTLKALNTLSQIIQLENGRYKTDYLPVIELIRRDKSKRAIYKLDELKKMEE